MTNAEADRILAEDRNRRLLDEMRAERSRLERAASAHHTVSMAVVDGLEDEIATLTAERDAAIQRAERAEARIREACDVEAATQRTHAMMWETMAPPASDGEMMNLVARAVLAPLLKEKADETV